MGEGQGEAGPVARQVTFHPAAHKDLSALDRQDQKRVASTIDSLATDGPGAQTHPLTGALKGWMSTKASRGHRIVHRDADDGSMHVGYVGLHEYDKAINRLASADPDAFKRQNGEDWHDHEQRVRRGLSLGHLTYDQARASGYTGSGHEDRGWHHLPGELYHTTTDVNGVLQHGLKAAHELGQKNGHGLGGTPKYLSMTDRADHAHHMLDALHEYHNVLTGKTTLHDLKAASERGDGASEPFHRGFLSTFGHDPHHAAATLDEKVIEPGFRSYKEAGESGLTPHPEFHKKIEGKDGQEFGTGWHRPMTDDEKLYKRHESYGAFSRARESAGGKPSVLFVSNDRKAFAAKDPTNFGVLPLRPKPGAQGFHMPGEHEWRTATGDAVDLHSAPIHRHASTQTPVPDNHQPYQHHHDWLPHGHFFAPGKPGLNPELFDGEHLRPALRQQILTLLDDFWTPKYGDTWHTWAKVYLAGSAVSHWWGDNNDLDTLVGVDYPRARQLCRPLSHLTDDEIDTRLTDEFRTGLNSDDRTYDLDGHHIGPFEQTWYTNSSSYDIRTLRPYAAYDVTADTWAVPPVEVPSDFSAESLPESDWDQLDALRRQVEEIAALPEGEREARGAELYDHLHAERHEAFTEQGEGLYDPANVTWKALDGAPGHPLAQLTEWKKAHDGAQAEETSA